MAARSRSNGRKRGLADVFERRDLIAGGRSADCGATSRWTDCAAVNRRPHLLSLFPATGHYRSLPLDLL